MLFVFHQHCHTDESDSDLIPFLMLWLVIGNYFENFLISFHFTLLWRVRVRLNSSLSRWGIKFWVEEHEEIQNWFLIVQKIEGNLQFPKMESEFGFFISVVWQIWRMSMKFSLSFYILTLTEFDWFHFSKLHFLRFYKLKTFLSIELKFILFYLVSAHLFSSSSTKDEIRSHTNFKFLLTSEK